MAPYKNRYRRRRRKSTYRTAPYRKRVARKVQTNTKKINSLVKSTLVRTYWKHNDSRVQALFPNVDEPHYRSFTPLIPSQFSLLFNKMTDYTDQQKVRINSCKVNVTLTLGNARQASQPIDYTIFCVKIKPRMRAQFYQHNSATTDHQINLIEDIHYTGNVPAGQATPSNKANIRLNPDIFEIKYYRHGYFSTNIKNQTAIGSDTDHVTSLQLRRCSFTIPYRCELKCDSWKEDQNTGPTSNRAWTDMEQDEIPLFNRYHILIFTSGTYLTIPNQPSGSGTNNLLQSSIQCLFNCTSAN